MLDRRSLPLSALRAFESAGKHLHLGRAGAELGVTHGAISHQIRALEDRLGVKLFVRESNKLSLTQAGERLLTAVREGFDRIMDGALHLDPDSLTGTLVVGCPASTAASWAVNYISQFQEYYPQTRIRVAEIGVLQKEIPREVEVAICYGEPVIGGRRLELLMQAPLYPVCNPRILHGRAPVTRPEHLTRFPLLHDNLNSWSRWFAAMDVPEPEDVRQIHFFNTNLSLTAARHGFGVALGNPFEVEEDLREGRLVQMLDRSIPESHHYYLVADHRDRQSLRARLFEEWIKRVITKRLTRS